MPRVAVMDLGTNTFHLLIVHVNAADEFEELHKEKYFVKLAEGGIEMIGAPAMERAKQTLRRYRVLIDAFAVSQLKVLGTAALRTASNGASLLSWAKNELDFDIEVIAGGEEAQFIHSGVYQSLPSRSGRYLVMDIGGGSVEFIIGEGGKALWYQSFPVGAAVLLRQFHRQDPIHQEEIAAIYQFLDEKLAPIQAALALHPTTWLIGAAGTFDVIANEIADPSGTHTWEIDLEKFPQLYQALQATTLADRQASDWIPYDRIDMIVVASVLIQYVVERFEIDRFSVSAYSLKEGVIADMLD